MKRLIIFMPFLLTFIQLTKSQVDTIRYLESNFETIDDQQQWLSLPDDPVIHWDFWNGGDPGSDPGEGNPPYAHQGSLNAIFYWSDLVSYSRVLVTGPIDLTDASKPTLTFWHTQAQSIFGTDNLYVLFKTSLTAPWDTIYRYTNAITNWQMETFNIDVIKGGIYLCPTFYLGFAGIAKGGHGVCLDDVIIQEKDTINRFVKSVNAVDVHHAVIPSGVKDIPIARVNVEVFGNTGNINLNSITFKSLCSNNNDFETGSFELIATNDEQYKTVENGHSTRIGVPVSISGGGEVTFNSLSYSLISGYTYLWLIADIKANASHGDNVDFKVEVNKISINGSTYPSSEQSPAGSNTIEESVFYDNFESVNSWTIQSDFEIAAPQGFICYVSQDPSYAYEGTKVLGTDLTTDGKYRTNIIKGNNDYYATTPSINLKYYSNVKLFSKKMMAFESNDHGVIDVSNNGGATWHNIWSSYLDGLTPDYTWTDLYITDVINEYAARKSDVKVRFGIDQSDGTYAYAGWNIDDFAIVGNYLTKDIAITQVIEPSDGCLSTGFDSIKVVIRNYSPVAITETIPIFFSHTGVGGTKVYDNITTDIPIDDSITVTLHTPANFIIPGNYQNFVVKTELPGDEDVSNDLFNKPIYVFNSVNSPYSENFETSGGYWRASENATWECKVPDGSIPPLTTNSDSWIVSPYGDYQNSDTSYIESSCYDLTNSTIQMVELKYWLQSEAGNDGACVQYSTDKGATWHLIDTCTNTNWNQNWNWYRNEVTALGSLGWSGSSGGWKTAKQILPAALGTETNVKFRILWAADDDNNARGLAIDDFKIYRAPYDIGVVGFGTLSTACSGYNDPNVTVDIRNFGVNTMNASDTIIVGLKLDAQPVMIDTLTLSSSFAPGDTIHYTFSEEFDFTSAGSHTFIAFTDIEPNPNIYATHNDSLTKNITVFASPVTCLPDTLGSLIPDTFVLRPCCNPNYTYNWTGGVSTCYFDVPSAGVYHVTVTDVVGNGCMTFDSVVVLQLVRDIGVSSIISPVNSCSLTSTEDVVVNFKNWGTDTLKSGERFPLAFIFQSQPVERDTITLLANLKPNQVVPFYFATTVNTSSIGSYTLTAYTSLSGDTINTNDTTTSNINVWGFPTVDIGPDVVLEALHYTLDAGSGFTSYLWNTGATNQTYDATSSGWYSVTATDIHGCPDTDSALVTLLITDFSAQAIVSPAKACDYQTTRNVIIRYTNSGTVTIPSGTNMDVSYKFNNGSTNSESFTLTQDLNEGGTIDHQFATTITVPPVGNYEMFLGSYMEGGDMRPENDTVTKPVLVSTVPDAGFEENSVTSYQPTFIADAGYGPDYTYNWSTGAHTQQITVSQTRWYRVTITDTATTCLKKDSIFVIFQVIEYDMISATKPLNVCDLNPQPFTLFLRHNGKPELSAGTEYHIGYQIDNGDKIINTFTLNNLVVEGGTWNLALDSTNGPIYPQTGSHSIRFFFSEPDDIDHSNDTSGVVTTTVFSSPDVNIHISSSDTISTYFPYIIDAGEGFSSYLWQDNSTGSQTYTVSSEGLYSVKVTDDLGCYDIDQVYIVLNTGLKDIFYESSDFIFYPQPAQEYLNIKPLIDLSNKGILTIDIISNQGKNMYQHKTKLYKNVVENLDVGSIPPGFYILRIYDNINYIRAFKIIVE